MNVHVLKIPSIMGVALEVITGEHGNGEERKEKIESLGYDYEKVQGCVNELCKLIDKYTEV